MERRSWPRLRLRLNVQFASPGEAEQEEEQSAHGAGFTDNVSAGGMYFLTPDWRQLHTGQKLDLRISGLSGYNNGPLFRTLGGTATVLRLDLPDVEDSPFAKAGVAMSFDERPRVELYNLSA
jgi:hypothetical protein